MDKFYAFFSALIMSVLLVLVGCQTGATKTEEKVVDIPVSTTSSEAKAAFKSGFDTWLLGNPQDANADFRAALKKDPDLAIAHVFAGATGGSAESFGTGLADAQAKLDGASDFEKQMVAFVETYAKNDVGARMDIIKKMAGDYPDAPICQLFMGMTYDGTNQIDSARAAYGKAVGMDANWVHGYSRLASSYLFSEPRDLAKAESNASKVVEKAPNNPRAHILLGDCYRGQNKLEQARNAYAKAIELAPEDYGPYYKKGHANTFLGNMEEARADFQNGVQYDENEFVPFGAYTYLYAEDHKAALGKYEDILAEIETSDMTADRAIGLKLDMLADCAYIALHQGDVKKLKAVKYEMVPLAQLTGKAVGSSEAIIQQDANMLYWDAIIAASEGNIDGAKAILQQIEEKLEPINNPRKLEGHNFAMGYVHMQEKKYPSAVAAFEKANSNWLYNQYWLAKAYEMNGQAEKAKALYDKVAGNNFNSVYNGLVRNEAKAKLTAV